MENRLLSFTSPIVEKALETGARGRTIKKTDYGVIGDAFFKKAQLDLDIANLQGDFALRHAQLQADFGLKQAHMESDLAFRQASVGADLAYKQASHDADLATTQARINTEIGMAGAQMNYDMAKVMIDSNLRLRDMKMQLQQNEVGFFEGLLNVAAGVVGGVATAGALGVPAIIGGAVGGVATAGAQAQGGRRGAQGAVSAINTIAQGAHILKQQGIEKATRDTIGSWQEGIQALAGVMNNPGSSPADIFDARQQFDTKLNALHGDLIQKGVNLEQADNIVDGMRNMYGGGIPGVANGGGAGSTSGKKGSWSEFLFEQQVRKHHDPGFKDPRTFRDTQKKYVAEADMMWAQLNGGDGMTRDQQRKYGDFMGFEKGFMDIGGVPGRRKSATSGGMSGSNTPSAPGQAGPSAARRGGGGGVANRQPEEINSASIAAEKESRKRPKWAGRPITQPPPQYSEPVSRGATMGPGNNRVQVLPQGPGLEYDEQPLHQAEQLSRQGAKTSETLTKSGTPPEELLRREQEEDAVATGGGDSLWDRLKNKAGQVVDRVDEFDEKHGFQALFNGKSKETLKENIQDDMGVPGRASKALKNLDQSITPKGVSKDVGEAVGLPPKASKPATQEKKYQGGMKQAGQPEPEKYEHRGEQVFKSSTDTLEIMDTWDMQGRWDDKTQEKMLQFPETAAEFNKLEKDIIRAGRHKWTPEQSKQFHHFMLGEGEDAMSAKSRTYGANVFGSGGTMSKSDFASNLSESMKKAGVRDKLTDAQIDDAYQVYSRAKLLSRKVARIDDSGTLSNQDVQDALTSIVNMHNLSGPGATQGLRTVRDMFYSKFKTKYHGLNTLKQQQQVELDFELQKRRQAAEFDYRMDARKHHQRKQIDRQYSKNEDEDREFGYYWEVG